jgi:hypothetical protein
LLIYTHRFLLSFSGSCVASGVFVWGEFVFCVGVLVFIYCAVLVYYFVVCSVAWGCLSVVSCFITVYDIVLIVLFYILSAAYCVS